MENLDSRREELGREMVVVKLDEEGEELEEVTMNMWQEILWQPELGNYQLRWLEVKKKIITKRASSTEVHLEFLKTAEYISRVYNGIVKEQKIYS